MLAVSKVAVLCSTLNASRNHEGLEHMHSYYCKGVAAEYAFSKIYYT